MEYEEYEETIPSTKKIKTKKNRIKKIKSKWSLSSRFLYLFYSIILTVAIVYVLADIALRIYFNRYPWYLVSVGLNVVLLCLIYFITVGIRNFTVIGYISTIPSNYLPIEQIDIPKKAYEKIGCELNKASDISSSAVPLPESIPPRGWGRKGTMYENIHFQTAIVQSSSLLESTVLKFNGQLVREPYMTIRQYINILANNKLINRDIGLCYVNNYEHACYSSDEIKEDEYEETMKLLAILLKKMQSKGAKKGHKNSKKK
ncbi:hypothetical protein BCR32DRAFT_295241 [Anaeromyces robustus]|uniref:Defect at low temperature protein 1 n=1 Tax=Anaeromyces robustus TaxID=1754192 RepID=A0A1Y1WXZ0_9FUNG|nr:hypothetical protein BCR32DRAFT_295241 [Anaeromyces robustus]|eukprot:ORX78066.1 hypothetical protein BCR32DRAFT_295241 [Anaeromyces robustus]